MIFLNRTRELERLNRLAGSSGGGLAVVHGRRRMGKTRLLLEWVEKHGGLYAVGDLSAPDVQRRYLATALAERLPGFADVHYPDWASLVARLAREARQNRWRGPLVIDELPYLVAGSPELPSVLQRFVDHEARDAKLVFALAGSSQRMMQGLVLEANAPLYGRAREILEIGPLAAPLLGNVFRRSTASEIVEHYTAWGGVPWYWELAADTGGRAKARIEKLVLDPLGPLHREPDHLLIEEIPSAMELRPILDAIGAGAHRLSEIAGRLGRPATALSRPISRLTAMGIVRREVPFGESERKTKKSLYRIADPFFRLWFRVVAPHRSVLSSSRTSARISLLERYYPHLVAATWEDLCRTTVPQLTGPHRLARLGPWAPPSRWWAGGAPEWDLVAESTDGKRLLLGEAKWSARPLSAEDVARSCLELTRKPAPLLDARFADHEQVRALFVPRVQGVQRATGAIVATAEELLETSD